MKAHIFLITNLKFHLKIHNIFGDIAENVNITGIPIFHFFCIFITASSPGVHTLFCLWRENRKQPQGETLQEAFRGQGQSVKGGKYTC